MKKIKTINIKEVGEKSITNINYPYIEYDSEQIKDINNKIYQDVMIFKEISEEEINNIHEKKYLSYVGT